MYIRHNLGKTGEEIAEIYLIKNGYKILERNFSCRQGEIDIIARDIKEIVFVEVKTRTNKKYGEPIDSITYYKKKHLIKSIQFYLYLKKLDNAFIRIDIIEIYKKDDVFLNNHQAPLGNMYKDSFVKICMNGNLIKR